MHERKKLTKITPLVEGFSYEKKAFGLLFLPVIDDSFCETHDIMKFDFSAIREFKESTELTKYLVLNGFDDEHIRSTWTI